MARSKFIPGLRLGEGFSLMSYGPSNVGKTHLMADMLREEAKNGNIRYVNTVGEDGDSSVGGMFTTEVGENIENMSDLKEFLGAHRKKPLRAIGLDSVRLVTNFALYAIIGEVRMPSAAKDGEKSKSYWGQLRFDLEDIFIRLKQAAHYIIATCPADKDGAADGGMTTPDLFGKLARGSAHWFDFVGHMRAEILGKGQIERTLSLAPSASFVTKQRLPELILEPIKIPHGQGGWLVVKNTIERRASK